MPSTDVPAADLWPQLSALLLANVGWVALGAVAVGAVVWSLARARPAVSGRVVTVLFGATMAGPTAEPTARRFLRIAFGLLWIVDGLLQAQPLMPGSFAADYLPADVGPSWFMHAQAVLTRAWSRHPVAADAATVWVQIGIGLLFLLGGRGLLNRVACWTAIGWSVGVWLFGESLGGLFTAGAGWLNGAPGAVLVYLLAALVLRAPYESWSDGSAAVRVRRLTALWLLAAAVITALPSEHLWSAPQLAAPFVDGVHTDPSGVLRAPIHRLASLATSSPAGFNVAVVAGCALLALALWRSGRTIVLAAAIVWCLATWWLAQDFGVLGGTATDPNTALPLALFLAAALPVWRAQPAPAATDAALERPRPRPRPGPGRPQPVRTRAGAWKPGLAAAAAGLALGLAIVVPTVTAAGLPRPPDAAAVAANSDGGLVTIPTRPIPAFRLQDQDGRTVSSSSLRGRVVVLTFLDPVCTSDCPIISAQLAMADRRLGALAAHADFVALDTNPVFHTRADVAAFTRSHALGALPNWHFLYGRPSQMLNLLARFGITVDVPTVGMIQHSEAVYFVDPDGHTAAYLDDGAATELTSVYAQQVRSEIRALLA